VRSSRDEVLRCALVDSLREHVDGWLPPLDGLPSPAPASGALAGLRAALDEGDPDEAVRHAMAVPEGDVDDAWRAVHDTVITDQWLVQHGPKQSVALHDLHAASAHPLGIVHLAAAARTAALVTALGQPRAAVIRQRLG
jgi:hypothetical protein